MSVQLCEFSVLSYLIILNSDPSGFSWLHVDLSTLKMYKGKKEGSVYGGLTLGILCVSGWNTHIIPVFQFGQENNMTLTL